MDRRGYLGLVAAATGLGTGCLDGLPSGPGTDTPRRNPDTVFVDAEASAWDADGTRGSPFPTITEGVERAEPGDTVQVAAGEYLEQVAIGDGGEPGAPITITGPPDAVLRSIDREYNVVIVRASHVHLSGLTIDGLEDPDEPRRVDSYSRSQLVQVRPPIDTDAYLEDIVVAPHRIGNSQKSLVSLDRTTNAEVGPFRVVGPAGAKYLYGDRKGHNGEIVYVGTSPSNLGTDWHPWDVYDETRQVHVHHIDNAAGHPHSELVNTKLGTRDVLVEYCTDGGGSRNTERYPAASVRFQGHRGTLRWCDLRNGQGHGVEIGSGKAYEAVTERSNPSRVERRGGTAHAVYGNRITGFDGVPIQFEVLDQGPSEQRYLCGNELQDDTEEGPSTACPDEVPDGEGIGHEGGDSPW